jgi:hypothetical protein
VNRRKKRDILNRKPGFWKWLSRKSGLRFRQRNEGYNGTCTEFDAAGNNIEDTSNEEKIQLKKWLATVSKRMWSRLLDEVEGEQKEGG